MHAASKNRRARRVILAVLLSMWPAVAGAQSVSVSTLKAAFLLNFVKFADWPDSAMPSGGLFTFCVAGDKAVFQQLDATIKLQPKPVITAVIVVPPDGPFQTCQLLYLGGLEIRNARRVIESLHHAPIFTVSDVDGFAEAGGIAQLKLENGKMRFAINPAAAQRARIALSAKLLTLATLIKDTPHDGR